MIIPRSLEEAIKTIKQLDDRLNRLENQNINMQGRRLINCGAASDESDYATLNDVLKNVKVIISNGGTDLREQSLAAYTTNVQNTPFSGIASSVAGTPYAAVISLNSLQAAYENLRLMVEDLTTKLKKMRLVK